MNNLFGSDSWLYIILVGFVVGLLARFITPGTQRLGCLLTIVLGIAGAVVASWFGRYMGGTTPANRPAFSVHCWVRSRSWHCCACSAAASVDRPAATLTWRRLTSRHSIYS